MDSLMDNCSFLKKDIDASRLTGHLYVFKFLIMVDGEPARTYKVCTRGKTKEDAEQQAREILPAEYKGADVTITKWIQLES